jgi:hypothetical protein
MEKPDNKNHKETEKEIESLKSDVGLLKDTVKNLNFIIDTLKESNKILSLEIMDIEHELDIKTQSLSEFLNKHGLSFEDIIEYETEKKIRDEKD